MIFVITNTDEKNVVRMVLQSPNSTGLPKGYWEESLKDVIKAVRSDGSIDDPEQEIRRRLLDCEWFDVDWGTVDLS
jgi:hypothetical protein